MKLESLNNPKYSLTPEKMGELVGGTITRTCTGGHNEYSSTNGWNSADYVTNYSGNDVQDGIIQTKHSFWGNNDVTARDRIYSNCSCSVGR